MKHQKITFYSLLTIALILSAATSASAGRGAFAGDSVGARASILGEAFVAVADDANALRWNPAGLTQLLQPELTSSHINFFNMGAYLDYRSDSKAINEDFIGLAWPNETAPVGISFLNLVTPGMMQASQRGAITDYSSYVERTLTLSVGKQWEVRGLGLSGGCNLNYLSLGGGSDTAGLGMDGGLLVETPGILPEFGLMMRGMLMDTVLGSGGLTVPAKTDVAMVFSPWRWLKLAGGLGKTSGDPTVHYSTGLELVLHWLSPFHLSFLAGYKTLGSLEEGVLDSQGESKAVGGSLRISRYKLDYAYEQHSLLGDTHRVSFGFFQNSPESFHLDRGRQAFEQLDDATAIRELEEVVHLARRKVEVYHMLALTYERMRMNDEAIRVLQRIQSLNYDYFIEQKLDQLLKDIQERR
jgi:hypothetical protein